MYIAIAYNMNNLIDNCFITDPLDLNYISYVVNQVLESETSFSQYQRFTSCFKGS